jgi:hypothetical protein
VENKFLHNRIHNLALVLHDLVLSQLEKANSTTYFHIAVPVPGMPFWPGIIQPKNGSGTGSFRYIGS